MKKRELSVTYQRAGRVTGPVKSKIVWKSGRCLRFGVARGNLCAQIKKKTVCLEKREKGCIIVAWGGKKKKKKHSNL